MTTGGQIPGPLGYLRPESAASVQSFGAMKRLMRYQRRTSVAAFATGLIATALLALSSVGVAESAQDRAGGAGYVPPLSYVCYRVPAADVRITIDGRLDEPAWQAALWTANFVDIEGDLKPRPRFRTRAKMLWDDRYFYIAAELEEPHVWGTHTEHDSVIFHDNDFEVFIDPNGDNHNYGEFEINALGTGWDLRLPLPYKDGGKADNSWEIPGLKTAVAVDGTLNDPTDMDRGWTVELAFPWDGLTRLADGVGPVPRDGDQWRVNFSRVEWRHEIVNGITRKVPDRREDNWVWSPQWKIDMHRPEHWGYVQFSTVSVTDVAASGVAFRPDEAGPAKYLLHRVYYAQRTHHERHKRCAATLNELGVSDLSHESLAGPVEMRVDAEQFDVTADVRLSGGKTERWHIRNDSRVWRQSPAVEP